MKTIMLKGIVVVLMCNYVSSTNYRLAQNIVPIQYTLDLTVNPELDYFSGSVRILLKVDDPDTYIVSLHSSIEYINITSINLDDDGTCKVEKSNNESDIVQLHCNKNLKKNSYLSIYYESRLTTTRMLGFYKSIYSEKGEDIVNKTLLATQFEPVYARTAFPCFDEPRFKATFNIVITCPKEYSVVSNTGLLRKDNKSNNHVKHWFKRTPVMSPYLVAFIISQFEPSKNEDEIHNGYKYNVYARPSAKKFMGIASTYGTKLIDIMSSWTKIEYAKLGNDQLYQVAIPDFAAGAMENWGLITYREKALLDEGNNTSASAKETIITVMAHEISHQWFGDYVTTNWWSNLWLNEGFATFFEYHIPSKIMNYQEEDLEMEKQFIPRVIHYAFSEDEQPTASPLSNLEREIQKPAQDEKKFDIISYEKGGSVIRMMSSVLGLETFQQGLTSYLEDRKYNYSTPKYLLNHLQKASGTKIESFATKMNNWIYEPGFPLVTAKLNKHTSEIILTQERFNNDSNTQWYIPITYTTSSKKNFISDDYTWLEPNNSLSIKFKDESWIIINLQVVGYYRVNYEAELLDMIITALKGKDRNNIDSLNKAQLINDVFNIARIGKLSYDKVFDLADYLNHETDYYPWQAALSGFNFMTNKLDYECQQLLNKRILGYINTAFPQESSISTNKHINILKDTMIQEWACRLDQPECIEYAKKTFENYKHDQTLPDYNKRNMVFCYGLKYSTNATKDYTFLFDIFKQSPSSIEQISILSSLGCIQDADVLSNYLEQAIAPNSPIRKQDVATVFYSVLSNEKYGLKVTIEFFEKNFKAIDSAMKGFNSITNILRAMARSVITDDQKKQVNNIISKHKQHPEIQLIKDQLFNIMDVNRKWGLTYGSKIKSILSDATTIKIKVAMIAITVTVLFKNVYYSC